MYQMISLGGAFKKRTNNNPTTVNATNITNKKTEQTRERVEEKDIEREEEKTKCISTQGQIEMNN